MYILAFAFHYVMLVLHGKLARAHAHAHRRVICTAISLFANAAKKNLFLSVYGWIRKMWDRHICRVVFFSFSFSLSLAAAFLHSQSLTLQYMYLLKGFSFLNSSLHSRASYSVFFSLHFSFSSCIYSYPFFCIVSFYFVSSMEQQFYFL